ncbi:uncharacterized protein LOC115890655 [Sitophilus oryzae]|uniref:Uncharacterized protein LOC115890655 n=1 Tax=Sitophilus oryzae TaxID=7048 RepID=A0A6J2YRV7_SITOR|nr:uncharacterized protein LOC115890655 [Sitophilus oryzae]
MKYLLFFLYTLLPTYVLLKPTEEISTLNSEDSVESRAGIVDVLNPANLFNSSNDNKDNSILKPLQSLTQINNMGDTLKDTKIFFASIQGLVMPGNVATAGISNFFKYFEGIQNIPNVNIFNQNKT